jgi:hypothetical protein
MRSGQAALERLVSELGELTATFDQARRNSALEDHPALASADSGLVRAAEAVTRVLLSEEPVEALQMATAALADARRAVEAAHAAIIGAGH